VGSVILCVGTTPVFQRTMVFPRLQIDAVNRATEVHETASGKSINVARVLHTLSEEALATGFLGGDRGKFIRHELSATGIAHEFIEVEATTRMCVTILDRTTRGATELVEEAQALAPTAWDQLKELITARLKEAQLMVLSGSLPPGGPVDFYAWCIKRAEESGVGVIVDASGMPLKFAALARPLLVKPNRAELASTFEMKITLRDSIKRMMDRGPQWMVVTQGRDGAILSDGKSFWRFGVPKVEAVNPIGSGDSLAAGVAAGIVRKMTILDACKLGMACGAANAETLTAGVVIPARVAELVEKVEVEPWT
jgi:tagatose 6-phosphate kinase